MFHTTTIERNSYTATPSHTTATEAKQESKREKFKRLLKGRLKASLDGIGLIENLLKNPYVYNYDHRDIEQIVAQLQESVDNLKTYWKVR